MKPAVPWSVKGVEPDAREAAKRAARSAGMTLGAWLNQKILEGEDADEGASTAGYTASRDYRAAGLSYDTDFGAEPQGLRSQRESFAERQFARPSPELGAVSQSLDALRRHLEDADDRAERTYGQVSRSLEAMLAKLDQVSARRRSEIEGDATDSLRAIKSALSDVNQRLSAVETRRLPAGEMMSIERTVSDIGRSFEAANARTSQRIDQVETSLDKVVDRLERGDSRRMDALRGLERAVTEIVHRVDDVSRRQTDAVRETDRSIAELRSEMAAKDNGLAPSLKILQERIFDLSEQFDSTRKSIGKAASEKELGKVERRIAEALDNTAKAEDLALLETRVTESAKATIETAIRSVQRDLREELVERLDAAEARSADAIKRIEANVEEAKLGLGGNVPDVSDIEAKIAGKFEEVTTRLESLAQEIDTRFDEMGDETRSEIEALRRDFGRRAPDPTPQAAPRPQAEAPEPALDRPAQPQRPPDRPAPAPDYTINARARLQDRAAAPAGRIERPGTVTEKPKGARTWIVLLFLIVTVLSVSAIAYSAWQLRTPLQTQEPDRIIETVPETQPSASPEGTPEPTTSEADGRVSLPDRTVPPRAGDTSPAVAENIEPETQPVTNEPPAATATLPPVTTAAPSPPTAIDLYAEAVELLEAETSNADRAAASRLRQAADMGLTIAQYRLATLYETGRGVQEDPNAARDWYERAAEGGNARSMHNLAVLYAEGSIDGEPDFAEAARWFAEAASYGIRDSQFNLAVLFERGLGVRSDVRQAYLWYSIAQLGGDTEAGNRRQILVERLEDDVRGRIDAAVASWEPRPLDPEANGRLSLSRPLGASPAEIARAQELLAAYGYTPGPADGIMGPRTADSIRAFERSAGMTVTGRVTPELISRLETELAARGSGG